MEIERDKVKESEFDSESFLRKVLQKFLIGDEAKSVNSPLIPHFKLSARMSPKMIDEREYMSHVLYASAVGSLCMLWCTRDRNYHRP